MCRVLVMCRVFLRNSLNSCPGLSKKIVMSDSCDFCDTCSVIRPWQYVISVEYFNTWGYYWQPGSANSTGTNSAIIYLLLVNVFYLHITLGALILLAEKCKEFGETMSMYQFSACGGEYMILSCISCWAFLIK